MHCLQGVKLTEKEQRDLEYKEQVYRLAVERKKQLGELVLTAQETSWGVIKPGARPHDERQRTRCDCILHVQQDAACSAIKAWSCLSTAGRARMHKVFVLRDACSC